MLPIIATMDPHANLSQAMVEATDALIAYRTNPHLDQRETGENAAALMARTLNGEIKPVQRAAFPPMAINIQSQQTAEPPLSRLYEHAARLRAESEIVSDSIVLGFPYADVAEMGSATLVVTNDDPGLAGVLAHELAVEMWEMREDFEPDFNRVRRRPLPTRPARRTASPCSTWETMSGADLPGTAPLFSNCCRDIASIDLLCAFTIPIGRKACESAGVDAHRNFCFIWAERPTSPTGNQSRPIAG